MPTKRHPAGSILGILSRTWLGLSLLSSVSIFWTLNLDALAAPAISPALIEQAKRMSPAQREALARQYGIQLGGSPVTANQQRQEQAFQEALQSPRENFETDAEERAKRDQEDDQLPRFGERLFAANNSMYEPPATAAVPQNYLLGPGDRLSVTLFGKTSGQYELIVELDGSLVVPDLGPLSVSGLTFTELKSLVSRTVKERMIGTEAFVSPVALRQISVMVVGEVEQPGNYLLSALANPTHALYAAGGPNELGSYRDIKLTRLSGETHLLDLYLLLVGGQPLTLPLSDGDTLYVPPLAREVSVDGEVNRPARYEVLESSTIADLIKIAGGPTTRAYSKGMVLQRFDASIGAPSILQFDGFDSSLVLEHGDRLTIRSGSDQPSNPIRLSGALVQPGVYEHKPGLRVGDYLPSLEANYLLESDLSRGLIVRRINAEQDIVVLTFSPVAAANAYADDGNPLVQPYDDIIILPLAGLVEGELSFQVDQDQEQEQEQEQSKQTTIRGSDELPTRDNLLAPIVSKLKSQAEPGQPAQIVNIYGAVNEPGEYPLIQGSNSVADLLALAGGVQDGAFLGSVEVRRRNISNNDVRSIIESVDLSENSSYMPQASDELRINFLPGWRERETAQVLGEVEFPGEYVLTPGETISSLIERAGGFTNDAFVDALRFRSANAKAQQQAAVDRALLQAQKAASLVNNNQLQGGTNTPQLNREAFAVEVEGRIVVDVPRILAGDSSADIAVQNGDEILVPRISEVVYVVGDVLEPGNYRHVDGTTIEQYINLAAGFTATAKKKDIYYILPNGRVQRANERKRLLDFGGNASEIVAGTTIVVPPNLDYSKPLDFYTQVSSVVFQSMASIAAFFNIARN
jgi:polysaccharide export outer membrane protein